MGEYVKLNDVVYFSVNFYNPTGGYSIPSQVIPQWIVYENSSIVPMLSGPMVARVGGSYVGSLVANTTNGFDKNSFYDIQASGKINNKPVFFSMKQFVLNDIVDANVVQVSGVPAVGVGVVNANIIQVSGVNVSLSSFGGSGGGTAPTAAVVGDAVWVELTSDHTT